MDRLVEMIRERSRELLPMDTGVCPSLEPLTGIRAVLFDIYGTLMISGVGDISLAGEMDREAAVRAAMETFCEGIRIDGGSVGALPDGSLADLFLERIRIEQDERRLDGVEYPEVDVRQVWRGLVVEMGLLPEADAYREGARLEALSLDYELRVNPVWPMPGLKEVLTNLRGRGLKLGIVSNAQFFTPLLFNAFMRAPLEAMGFTPDYCCYSYEYLEAKPSTFLYETAAAAILRQDGIPPDAVLYVGNDRRNDIAPAHRVGFRTALFAGDARSLRWRENDPIAGTIQPDRVITELGQLKEILSGSDK